MAANPAYASSLIAALRGNYAPAQQTSVPGMQLMPNRVQQQQMPPINFRMPPMQGNLMPPPQMNPMQPYVRPQPVITAPDYSYTTFSEFRERPDYE